MEERGLRVFVQRQIFGPKKDTNGEWIGLHNEEIHSLYHSPNTFRVIKSKRLRWAGQTYIKETFKEAYA